MKDTPDAQLKMARVSHSVLHPQFLAEEVAQRYDIPGPVSGLLLYRGMNDVYLIRSGDEKYALRVWRKTWRDVDNVAVEMNFLDFLRRQGFPASVGIPARDGSLYFKLDSPEGPRAIALYDWAPGKKFGEMLSEPMAKKIGAALAQMHVLGIEYSKGTPFTIDEAINFDVNMPALLEFVYDRPDDVRDYPIIAKRLTDKLIEMQSEDVPLGICHRDFHPSNVHVDEAGRITLLDFDGVGVDYLMQDVKNYVWGNLFYDFSPAYGEAFERGYQTVRPFTVDEIKYGELFLMAKAFRLIAGMAHSSVAVGRGTLRFRNLDWLGDYIKSRARDLGLLDR